MSEPRKICYTFEEETGNIAIPTGLPPFDGKPYLIQLANGWVEAYWSPPQKVYTHQGYEYRGWKWVCLDDQFTAELDEALFWMPLPDLSRDTR